MQCTFLGVSLVVLACLAPLTTVNHFQLYTMHVTYAVDTSKRYGEDGGRERSFLDSSFKREM